MATWVPMVGICSGVAPRVVKLQVPGDSKWPFHPLVGGHLTIEKGHGSPSRKRSPAELPGGSRNLSPINFFAKNLCRLVGRRPGLFWLIWLLPPRSFKFCQQKIVLQKGASNSSRRFRSNPSVFVGGYVIQTNPIGSMYGIYTYIWLIFMVNVGKYTIHGSYGNSLLGDMLSNFRLGDVNYFSYTMMFYFEGSCLFSNKPPQTAGWGQCSKAE